MAVVAVGNDGVDVFDLDLDLGEQIASHVPENHPMAVFHEPAIRIFVGLHDQRLLPRDAQLLDEVGHRGPVPEHQDAVGKWGGQSRNLALKRSSRGHPGLVEKGRQDDEHDQRADQGQQPLHGTPHTRILVARYAETCSDGGWISSSSTATSFDTPFSSIVTP